MSAATATDQVKSPLNRLSLTLEMGSLLSLLHYPLQNKFGAQVLYSVGEKIYINAPNMFFNRKKLLINELNKVRLKQ